MKDFKIKGNYDLFSKEISLYFKGSDYYSTLFGKIATILYIIIYLILFVYYSSFGLLKKKGTFTSHETITKQLPNLTLSKNSLYFTFSLEDPDTYDNFIDNEIYYTEAYYKHGKRVGSNWIWEQKKLEIGPCEMEYFGEKYQDLIKLKPYKSYLCIKNLNEYLFGHFVYDDYSFIFIQFFPCVNDSIHHCKPQNIIDKYLNGTFFDLQMQSVLINYENYENPVKENFEDVYSTVGIGFKREIHFFFKLINFKDYGFFGESLGEKKYVQYDYTNPMITLTLNSDFQNNQSICDVTIKLSDKTLIIKREYTNIMEICSKIGGIMVLILKVFNTVSLFLVSTLFDISVINDLFQFYRNKEKTLYKGIKIQNFFKIGNSKNLEKDKNCISKNELKCLKPSYERKNNINYEQKISKNELTTISVKNITQNTSSNDTTSKNYIVNNVFSNISYVNNNIKDRNNNIIDDLNKKNNLKSKDNLNNKHSIDDLEIIKIVNMNPFILCLFSLFPIKFTNKKNILLKMGLYKLREELDITNLFRRGLLNNKAIEILQNNSSLLSFDKEDLIFTTYKLYVEE